MTHIQKAFIVIMQLAFTAVLILFLTMHVGYLPIPRDYLTYFPLLAIAAVILYFLFEYKYGGSLGWKDQKAILRIGLGFLYGGIFISIIFVAIWLLHGINIVRAQTSPAAWYSILPYLGLFFIVAFQEEIFVRGYLFGMIKRQYGALIAIFTTSLLFALLHLLNPSIFSSPFPLMTIILAGILLAVLREYTQSIWLSVGFHWSWNLLQGNFFGFSVSGLPVPTILKIHSQAPVWISGGEFGAEGSLVTVVLLLLGILYLWRKKQSRLLLLPRKPK